jgi:sugar phosphate isomerase/epimerase
MPYRLSAFGDEISTDIQVQLDNLLANGITFCALRGCNGKNVMELEDFQLKLIKTQFNNRGVHFSCVGSPVGKIQITDPFEPELERLKKAAAIAKLIETRVVRVFSFFMPQGKNPADFRGEVLARMKALADLAKTLEINLLVENEKDLYGDTAARQLDVIEHIASPHVRAAFDFSNFVQCNDDPWAAWQKLKPYVLDFHIKDCRAEDKREVPAGEGAGKVREILADAFKNNWKGYLSFEPHLSESGTFKGFTGPKLFKVAVDALKKILTEIGAK